MDVRLSTEQQALRDAVALAVDRLGPATVADLDDTGRAARLDEVVASAGWRELRTADGAGPLASGVEAAIVAEELGRGLADVAFLGPTMAAELRRLSGASQAVGPETVAFAPDLSAPARAVGTTVAVAVAVDCAGARRALVLATSDRGDVLAEVAPGRPEPPLDLTRHTSTSESAPVAFLGDRAPAIDGDALTRWTALGLALTCADLVGVMRGALSLGCEYAMQRHQYGAAIGSYQAVQHLLADAHVATEGSRSAALHAAWAVDALDGHDALAAGAVAKAYCSRAALDVCEAVIQVHGGIGNTWDCLAHVYLRRALLSTDLFGGVGPNLGRVLVHHGFGTR
jgi:alkylation response protein AidB-like acyl-CoA dehydrogenase